MVQYGFYFDQSRCIGCRACSVACKQWHGVQPGPEKWMRIYEWEKGTFPDLRVRFIAIPCYHCERAVCMRACPNGAITKENEYGAVLVDPNKCKGTRRCWMACPYGSILFASDKAGEKASKCNMCIDRIKESKSPICVLSCSMRALEFGPLQQLMDRFGRLQDLDEMPSSKIARPAIVFKASQGKRDIIPWDGTKALALWKKRGPSEESNLPDTYGDVEDFIRPQSGLIGRNRLVLKSKNEDELMYLTMDDD